ncbi:hypothetical protein [Noviherbaspirillum saxi]|uniref:Uncharacterized protein n=1 Tax=Noviherbaspirillum saxi TaxID=2320863 RepID=A0A3A3G0N6_9BURK|nr:hypothetical protein [Noviherbaspirillum saxi]RJF91633.1 hypothetical protein D3871_23315 [Noviherbaspirillum saxi]
MHKFFSSIFLFVARALLVTIFSSGIAMAAYVCPELVKPPMTEMMEGMPCADMDKEKPVHCAEFQAGDELALEHLASIPSLTPPTILFAMPAVTPVVPLFLTAFWSDFPLAPVSDPPYLRTQRLRI